jgi:hypothetical protein
VSPTTQSRINILRTISEGTIHDLSYEEILSIFRRMVDRPEQDSADLDRMITAVRTNPEQDAPWYELLGECM